jgi:hypothetical protein
METNIYVALLDGCTCGTFARPEKKLEKKSENSRLDKQTQYQELLTNNDL